MDLSRMMSPRSVTMRGLLSSCAALLAFAVLTAGCSGAKDGPPVGPSSASTVGQLEGTSLSLPARIRGDDPGRMRRLPVTDPGARGPLEVGFRFVQYLDSSRNPETGGRHIPVHLFYPVDPGDVGPTSPLASYPLDTLYGLAPEIGSAELEKVGVDRAYATPRPSSRGPFPLVVFSSGWGLDANFYLYAGIRLASHGFVVAVLTHQGDGLPSGDTSDHIAMAIHNRPLDVAFALTRLLDENGHRGNPLHHLIEPDRVAASGHSLGGYTALVLGGAGDDDTCDAVPLDFAMGPPPPGACGPSAPDPRVRAVLAVDAANQFLRRGELARIRLPVQGVGQPPDSLEYPPPSWASYQARIHAAVRSEHAYRADVHESIHLSFSNFCQMLPVWYQNGLTSKDFFDFAMGFACGSSCELLGIPVLLPSTEVQRLAMKVAIPFLKTFVSDDERYAHMVEAEWVNRREANVSFFETERGGTEHQAPAAPYLDPSWIDPSEAFDWFRYPPTSH